MTSPSRKARGMRTQLVTALHLAANGWPHAQTAGSGRSGVDVLGTPGLSIEVKARRDWNALAWVKQAAGKPGVPFVVVRPDGMGETTVGSWPCVIRLDDLIDVLRAAGYGDPKGEAAVGPHMPLEGPPQGRRGPNYPSQVSQGTPSKSKGSTGRTADSP